MTHYAAHEETQRLFGRDAVATWCKPTDQPRCLIRRWVRRDDNADSAFRVLGSGDSWQEAIQDAIMKASKR